MTILPLDEVVKQVGPTGEHILCGAELTATDRVVASFACALMLWLSHNEAALLQALAETVSDEMAATFGPLQ
jgi:hypothetical protein